MVVDSAGGEEGVALDSWNSLERSLGAAATAATADILRRRRRRPAGSLGSLAGCRISRSRVCDYG